MNRLTDLTVPACLRVPSLALCRMARIYGIEVEEATYLPMRFLAPGSLRDERP